MTNKLINEEVDILKRPEPTLDFAADANAQVTIGDLHANTIKLLFTLTYHGFVELSDAQYDRLASIYYKDINSLTHEDLLEFNHILSSLTFNQNAGTIRLIGDDFADRGKCDWFTLNLFTVMRLNDIKVEVLASNHGMDFLLANEKKNGYNPVTLLKRDSGSMFNLHHLIQRGVLAEADVQKYVDIAYKPIIKALSYTLSEDKSAITLYSHAPIGTNTIRALAYQFGVAFDDKTPEALGATIDAVNEIFAKYVHENKLHEIIDESILNQGYENNDDESIDMEKYPLEFILWNRDYDVIECPKKHLAHKYQINYVHGHDSELQYSPKHIFNLDNYLGKENNTRGMYSALYSHQTQLRQHLLLANKQPVELSKPPIESAAKSKLSRSKATLNLRLSTHTKHSLLTTSDKDTDPGKDTDIGLKK